MKLSLEAQDLQQAVTIISKGLPFVQVREEFNRINFLFENGKLTLFTQTLTQIKTTIKNFTIDIDENESSVAFAVGGTLFADIVKRSSGLAILDIGSVITFKSGNLVVKFPKLDCLNLAKINSEPLIKLGITAQDFNSTISGCLCCAATDNSRPILQGINFKHNKGEDTINVVALDGYRLAKAVIKNTDKDINNFSITISSAFISLINSVATLANIDDMIFNLYKNNIVVEMENYYVQLPLLNGEFIDYARIIPQNDYIITTNKAELMKAVATVQLVAGADKNKRVTFIFNADKKSVSIYSKADNGEGLATLTFDGTISNDFRIDFNSKYLTDALKNITADNVTLTFSTNTKPFEVKTDDIYYMILPIRIQQ